MEEQQPFKSLIASSSLVAALLYVAGFAYRWSYYYNFGVPELVYEMNVQSFFIVAMELVRTPANLLKTFGALGACLAVFEIFLIFMRRKILATAPKSTNSMNISMKSGSNLLIDSLRAILILLIIYQLSSQLGRKSFLNDSTDSVNNYRPRVIIIDNRPSAGKAACGSAYNNSINVFGSRQRLKFLLDNNATCSNTISGTWRLLHRDSNFLYLFLASPTPDSYESAKKVKPWVLNFLYLFSNPPPASPESEVRVKPWVTILPNSSDVELFFW